MGAPKGKYGIRSIVGCVVLPFFLWIFPGCSAGPLTGLVYTHVKAPLTKNLHDTPAPRAMPKSAKIIEVREPITGLGLNARVRSNAIGDIAKDHGLTTLYFADQEFFSILGIWTSHKVVLYGE